MAEELALVLVAEGIGARVERAADGWHVAVPEDVFGRAEAALAAFERENRPPPPPPAPPTPIGGRWVGATTAAALLLAYLLTGSREVAGPRFVAGAADARSILHGEIWRAVTALTLHSDASHLAGNAVAGAVLVSGVARVFGSGAAVFLVVLAGTLGNLANAVLRGPPHTSVGASTAVLGAVGLLSGSAAVRMARDRATPGRAWIPVAAGLALLAMLGADERTDLGAHLSGFVAGSGLGVVAALVWRGGPGPVIQRLLGVLALAVVVAAWGIALAA